MCSKFWGIFYKVNRNRIRNWLEFAQYKFESKVKAVRMNDQTATALPFGLCLYLSFSEIQAKLAI